MRIGIFTHPLINNYGGILQAYALTYTLRKLGHELVVFSLQHKRRKSIKGFLASLIYALHIPPYYKRHINSIKSINQKSKNTLNFVNKNIPRTKDLNSSKSIWKECLKQNIGCLIAGSDQVWRADFELNYGLAYFFDFIPQNSKIKMLSYAASFGLDNWGYDEQETTKIKNLVNRFSGVSVREYEGMELCKKYLGITPKVLLDPTLLLTASDYYSITSPQKLSNYIFVYWLGDRDKLNQILKDVDPTLQIIEIRLRSNKELPPIEDWLSYIKYASYVITDSFHGCVFSIIFQKQFKVEINESGGYGRIESLFKLLCIEEKLKDKNFIIDFTRLSLKIKELRKVSIEFLERNIKTI